MYLILYKSDFLYKLVSMKYDIHAPIFFVKPSFYPLLNFFLWLLVGPPVNSGYAKILVNAICTAYCDAAVVVKIVNFSALAKRKFGKHGSFISFLKNKWILC